MRKDLIDRIFDAAAVELSEILPSQWAEQNRFVPSDTSQMEGMFTFDNSPYTRKIVDFFHRSNPARIGVVMKGSQLGFSTSVIENAIGYIISQDPGNILFLVGHADLVADAVRKTDIMLDNSGLRTANYIKPTTQRKRNTKSGDTDTRKEFAGGELRFGIANHKMLRNISIRYMFLDDFEAMKSGTAESGDTLSMAKARTKAYEKTYKMLLMSSPETTEGSNIEPAYLSGDQQKWHIPCPCCGTFIVLEWEIDSKAFQGEKAGITWQLDENMKLIPESVGYTCQECGEFFDDRNKSELLLAGDFFPTAEPKDPDVTSFHLSSLYAPTFMRGWLGYVKDYLEANPPGGKRDEKKHQTFVNQCLGLTYEPQGESVSADTLQLNIRNYPIGTAPEKLSLRDGNGRIVMITLGADMNGAEDDARLDWEIVAWSESGSSYSIDHGSIGTFVPKENQLTYKPDRRKWTYRTGHEFSVWPELDRIMAEHVEVDGEKPRKMKIFAGCLDTGYLATTYAYPYTDSRQNVYAVKGDKQQGSGIILEADYRAIKPALERPGLWILNTNHLKDTLATNMRLNWNERMHASQPSGFMNYPVPSGGKYLLANYFSHFEAEHKVTDKNNRFSWKKKTSGAVNHMFDCRVYAIAAKDIFLHKLFESLKIKKGGWVEYVAMLPKAPVSESGN